MVSLDINNISGTQKLELHVPLTWTTLNAFVFD